MKPLAVTRRGAGPPLALVHGWGFSGAALAPLADALAVQHTVELVDLPGHGDSHDVPMPPDLDGLAALLDATLPATRDWVGWSLGGLAGLALARTKPGRVRRLGLLATTPRFTAGPGWGAALPAAELLAFADGLASDPTATLGRFAALVARGDAAGRDVLRALRRVLAAAPTPDPAALATGLDLLAGSDLTEPDPGTPTLWLLGMHDALVPAAVTDALAGWHTARVETVADAGHAPFLSATTACAVLLAEFFDE